MALYQPTNAIPSSYTKGTVDVNDTMEISWQVNGNSAMTAFQIDFYLNDYASTYVTSTGKLPKLGETQAQYNLPFYGTDRFGRPQFFAWNSKVSWKDKGFINGNEYKYKITQWYEGENSVIKCRTGVSLEIGNTYYFKVTNSSAIVYFSVSENLMSAVNVIYYSYTNGAIWVDNLTNIVLCGGSYVESGVIPGGAIEVTGSIGIDTLEELFVSQTRSNVITTRDKPILTISRSNNDKYSDQIDLLENQSIKTDTMLATGSLNYFSFDSKNENEEIITSYASFTVADIVISSDTIIFYNVSDNNAYYYVDENKLELQVTVSENEPIIGNNLGKSVINLQTSVGFFKAEYEQSQGDPIRWIRWQIATVNNGMVGEILADTGDIYTPTLNYEFNGFFNGQQYAVRAIGESESGQRCNSNPNFDGWIFFTTNIGNPGVYTGQFMVQCINKENTSLLEWSGLDVIPASVSPENYSPPIVNEKVYLKAQSSVMWDKIIQKNGEIKEISFSQPWCTVWVGKIGFQENTTYGLLSIYCNTVKIGISTLRDNTLVIRRNDIFNPIGTLNIKSSCDYYILYVYPSNSSCNIEVIGYVENKEEDRKVIYIENIFSENPYIKSVEILGQGGVSFVQGISVYNNSFEEVSTFYEKNPTFVPNWGNQSYKLYMNASFNGSLDGGVGSSSKNGFRIYRQEIGKNVLMPIATVSSTTTSIKDYGIVSRKAYKYSLYAYDSSGAFMSAVENEKVVATCFKNYSILVCDYDETNDEYHVRKQYLFALNLSAGSVGNNNSPTLNANFTRYPTRMPSTQNYASGTLQGLIGAIYTVPALIEQIGNYKWTTKPSTMDYFDNVDLEKELYDLSTAPYQLFLRDMKGRLRMIATNSAITMTTNIKQKQQSISISLPWVEIGDASDVTIIQTPNDYGWNNDNQILDVSLDVDVATGDLSATYPFPYNGTKFYLTGVNKETLTAKTPLGITPAQFELSETASQPNDGKVTATVKVNNNLDDDTDWGAYELAGIDTDGEENPYQVDGADSDDFDGGDFGYGNFDETESEDE